MTKQAVPVIYDSTMWHSSKNLKTIVQWRRCNSSTNSNEQLLTGKEVLRCGSKIPVGLMQVPDTFINGHLGRSKKTPCNEWGNKVQCLIKTCIQMFVYCCNKLRWQDEYFREGMQSVWLEPCTQLHSYKPHWSECQFGMTTDRPN